MINSQPVSLKYAARYHLDEPKKPAVKVSERMGHFMDDIDREKMTFADRLDWFVKDIRGSFYHTLHSLKSLAYWLPTILELRPWEGFSDGFTLLKKHLESYRNHEIKHGHSMDECIAVKLRTTKLTLKLLRRLSEPDTYDRHYLKILETRFPKYLSHITRLSDGSTMTSGRFVPLGAGWVGYESGLNPRRGYFEFVDGTLTQLDAQDKAEADRLLAELNAHDEAVNEAYRLAKEHFDRDLGRLGKLLKENMYNWWD